MKSLVLVLSLFTLINSNSTKTQLNQSTKYTKNEANTSSINHPLKCRKKIGGSSIKRLNAYLFHGSNYLMTLYLTVGPGVGGGCIPTTFRYDNTVFVTDSNCNTRSYKIDPNKPGISVPDPV